MAVGIVKGQMFSLSIYFESTFYLQIELQVDYVDLERAEHKPDVHRTYWLWTMNEVRNGNFTAQLLQLLKCPVCLEYTNPPIRHCVNGHLVCNNCFSMVDRCPTCRGDLTHERNLAMEQVANMVTYPCENDGCTGWIYPDGKRCPIWVIANFFNCLVLSRRVCLQWKFFLK